MERGEELPCVEINKKVRDKRGRQEEEKKEMMRANVLEFVVMGGKMPNEVFVELMECMVTRWDDDARRA